jgi:hypothetical protein
MQMKTFLGCAILALVAAGMACNPADAFTNYIVSGPGPGGGGRQGTDYWVSCPNCTLYGYDSGTGKISLIAPFSSDSGPDFSYVVGSIDYDPLQHRISCICSKADSDSDAAIYTVSARSGKTLRKLAWDRKVYGVGETMIAAGPKARLVLRKVIRTTK